ncbi:hypothetical protein [Rhizobium sp. Leaf386]|uniref:hypothetical protein n=1 Tax=Rhizobium sp. Leaf386 TaxID=1736359 RepID=UPI000712A9E7|nr:hypothetical protein [Rhizobium sp. Leaf386]KQS88848.1 hypothetical protein ASG50_28100 [Rhizobium sp. Leaf386]
MAVLKDAIKALDPTPDKKNDITLLLNLLAELCEQKVIEIKQRVEQELRTAGDGENRTIPVVEILARHTEYRAYVKDDAGKLATEVSGAVKKFVSGGADNIVGGIADLVTSGLEAILGSAEGVQAEMSSYYIVVQDYGIARYDVCAWTRRIEASGITSKIENAMVIVAFKSSVDVSKLSFNTFLLAYGEQLAAMNFPANEQAQYIEYAEKIYNKLRGLAGSPSGDVRLSNANISMQPSFGDFHAPGRFRGSLWGKRGRPRAD